MRVSDAGVTRDAFPRVPAYAWSWLQRSRPVLQEVAARLTGARPDQHFSERLRQDFDADAFVRDVVIGAVCDVAFSGRIPDRRPSRASWDRGLVWWAAAIAGIPVAEFEARSTTAAAEQGALFEAPPAGAGQASSAIGVARHPRPRSPSAERAALARALRQLLEHATGDQVPAAAIRQLVADLEPPSS